MSRRPKPNRREQRIAGLRYDPNVQLDDELALYREDVLRPFVELKADCDARGDHGFAYALGDAIAQGRAGGATKDHP